MGPSIDQDMLPRELGPGNKEGGKNLTRAAAKLDADPASLDADVDALPHLTPEHQAPKALEGLVGSPMALELHRARSGVEAQTAPNRGE